MVMKIVTVIGARPQFIKAATVSRVLSDFGENIHNPINEVIVHTGQHYDKKMSEVFFNQLGIPHPQYNLGIAEKNHGAMTGRMLEQIEKVLLAEKPHVVLVYGDTNSTLAAALAAAKIHIPVAHVEAGLRSFNMAMPEEINRILADRVSDMLFCPTQTAVVNLANEGVTAGVHLVGDVMYDAALYYRKKAAKQFSLDRWRLEGKDYILCTIHRAENTDNREKLEEIFSAFNQISHTKKVVIPLHPRTLKMVQQYGLEKYLENLLILEPVSYLEMTTLIGSAQTIMTDSGGLQKEAFFHRVPCITLRDETEWIETIEMGWNCLCPAKLRIIMEKWSHMTDPKAVDSLRTDSLENPYGTGDAAESIVNILIDHGNLNN